MIKLVRVYDINNDKSEKGYTLLVDRLWPRGIKKNDLKADEWLKDAAPSVPLRKWFNHDPAKWQDFRRDYKNELKEKTDLMQRIKDLEKKHDEIILLYAAKDPEHNHALVLKEFLDSLK